MSNSSNSGVYSYSSSASILSIINKEGLAPFKSMVSSPQHAIYRSSGDGPTFSGGHDSNISNNANSHIGSYTNFHNSYCLISSGVQNTKTALAGSYGLALYEVEVVYLIWVTWHREQIISDGVEFFFCHRSDLYTCSEEFFKTHIDTWWYGSFFGSFLVVSHWNYYLISRRDCDAYFNRCNAIRLTEWLELKQNPNNLFLVSFIDQVESHIAFLLLCCALMIYTLSLSTKWTERLNDLKMLQNQDKEEGLNGVIVSTANG